MGGTTLSGPRALRAGVTIAVLAACGQAALADANALRDMRWNPAFTGAGVKVGMVEAGGAVPELAPVNNQMPQAGAAGGQNGRVTLVNNPFGPAGGIPGGGAGAVNAHATGVAGAIVGPFDGTARSAQVFAAPVGGYDSWNLITQRMFLPVARGGNDVRVMNMSLTGVNRTSAGNADTTSLIDWSALYGNPYENKLTIVAGNETAPPGQTRTDPWDNFNGITVGATGRGGDNRRLASYNLANRTTDASPYGANSTRVGGRYKTDIVAPGGDFGNALDLTSQGGRGGQIGTSFATPYVTGAAASLLAGRDLDHRVTKALLLNGASVENLRDGANNDWAPVGNVGNKTSGANTVGINVGWDDDLGTGLLDITTSHENLQAGNQRPGNVRFRGWNFREVDAAGFYNQYILQVPDVGFKSIISTLAISSVIQLNDTDRDGLFSAGETFARALLDDLDLELWNLTTNEKVAQSTSDADSIEHIRYDVGGEDAFHTFAIRVNYFHSFSNGPKGYGLAWRAEMIPTPAGALALIGGLLIASCRRRA